MRLARVATTMACTVAGWVAAAGPAHAQKTSAEAAATALFDEGRRLMDQHRWGDACPKLAESEAIAPSGGTLINLADCYEHTGQTASAWVAWKDAAARADAAGKTDVERRALARAGALEPMLARLTIAIDGTSDVEGLEVKRDGVPVGHAEFGMAIPVDPGPHAIEAAAPKKKAFSARIEVAPRQTDAHVVVSLADEAVAPLPSIATPISTAQGSPSPAEPPPSESSGGGPQKTVGLVVAGAGVAGIAIGTAFGLDAMSKNSQAKDICRTPTLCPQRGLDLTASANNSATASTVAFVAGAAALAGGIVLYFTAPSSNKVGIVAVPIVGASYQGVAIDAVW